jgi:hypothetical protein
MEVSGELHSPTALTPRNSPVVSTFHYRGSLAAFYLCVYIITQHAIYDV